MKQIKDLDNEEIEVKADFKIGETIDYHGRSGKIIDIDDKGLFIVHFEDINDELAIAEEELIEQNF